MKRWSELLVGAAAIALFACSSGGDEGGVAAESDAGGDSAKPALPSGGTSGESADAATSGAASGGATSNGDVSAAGGGSGGMLSTSLGEFPELAPLPDGVWVRVRNDCRFPLWIRAAGSSGVLEPENVELASGELVEMEAPREWSAARITAYKDGPGQGEIEKGEATISDLGDSSRINYNVTYVDWVGLPIAMQAYGGDCEPDYARTGCFAPQADVLSGCPDGLLDGSKCLAPRSYCANSANESTELCHSLDDEIERCERAVAGCPQGGTTPEVYACSGPFSEEPRFCAALNRHTLDDPDSDDISIHYQDEPYNVYAKWVHEFCPGVYAFSYDDWLAQGGFRACVGDELRVTFCPGG